jgi:lipopolysaccharide export LptBFGC system permease protein LptF
MRLRPRILDRLVGRQILWATATGVLLLSAVMVLGNVYKKLGQLLGDAELPLAVALEFMALLVPFSLIFTIPWAFLTAILLVFGRLSADNEWVAMKMTGSPVARLCAPVFVLALLFSGLCYWVNVDLAPSAKNRMKRLFYEVAVQNPEALFQPGRVLDRIPGLRIFTTKRDGRLLEGLEIVELDKSRARRLIRAKHATLVPRPGELDFTLELKDAEIESYTLNAQKEVKHTDYLFAEQMAMNFPLSRMKDAAVNVNASMKSTPQLWQELRDGIDALNGRVLDAVRLSHARTELSKRYSFSLACLTFALVAIPLGVTAQRRETSTGFALSLLVATLYIGIIIVADTLHDSAAAMPHLIMWLPNVLFMGIGGWMFQRLCRR